MKTSIITYCLEIHCGETRINSYLSSTPFLTISAGQEMNLMAGKAHNYGKVMRVEHLIGETSDTEILHTLRVEVEKS